MQFSGAKFVRCTEEGSALPVFRRCFSVTRKVVFAQLTVTALGCYLCFLNGKRVGDFELEPGTDEMAKRKSYTVYNVTRLIASGANVLSAVVGSGWWKGRIAGCYGKEEGILMHLCLRFEDGEEQNIVTDSTFRSARKSAYLESDIYDGESYDARIPDDWKYAGFNDENWPTVCENTEFTGEIVPFRGPHISVKRELERRAKVTVYCGVTGADDSRFGCVNVLRTCRGGFELKKGETAVVDFGQNFSGWEKFTVAGAAGTELMLRHGEVLNDGMGEHARNCDGAGGSLYRSNLRSAKATTRYILRGGKAEEYHPSFTYYGFRYLEITASADVRFRTVVGEVLTSLPARTGFYSTSNKFLNKFVENAFWGQLSNYIGVPTDCPQRDERLGWTADTQVFAEAGCYLGESKQFLEKFLVCMRDAQAEDGSFSGVAPTGQYHGALYGGTGWADAGIMLPHILWQMYGDTSVIEENWAAMQRYLDGYLARSGGMGGKPHWGDWLSYQSNDDEIREILGVCYYAWDAKLMAEMAEATGRGEDAARYRALYQSERELFRTRYVCEGRLVRGEQSVCAHALWLDLLEPEEEEGVKTQLLENLAANGCGLRTGFLGTKILLHVLTKIGRSDLAFSILLKDDCPSFLYPVKHGATTVWERWNSYTAEEGFADKNMNSFNHYAYGSAVSWMFTTMAGIAPAKPGFEEVLVAPCPDRRVREVIATYVSVRGQILVCSKIKQGRWDYSMIVPEGTPVVVRVPKGVKNVLVQGLPAEGEIRLDDGRRSVSIMGDLVRSRKNR